MMGGLYIANGTFACASSFVVTNGSTNAILTAGHCGADGEWFQGDFLFPYDVGSTTTRVFDVPGDVEVIPLQTQTDASHYVYISTTSCGFLCTSHNLRVISRSEADAVVGELTCISLVNEKTEQCGGVTAINQCVIYPDNGNVQVCNQVFSWLTATPGDSGGPFYQTLTDGTSMAQGILSGTPNAGGTNYTQISAAYRAISAAGGGTWAVY